MATPSPLQGMVGTPAAWARMVDPILSPRAAMAVEGGPRKRIPVGVSSRASGSSGFSEAWPLQQGRGEGGIRSKGGEACD